MKEEIKKTKDKFMDECNDKGKHNKTKRFWKSWDILVNPNEWNIDGSHIKCYKCFDCVNIKK